MSPTQLMTFRNSSNVGGLRLDSACDGSCVDRSIG